MRSVFGTGGAAGGRSDRPQGISPSARALGASLARSSIEWYDYLLYGTLAPLVFVKRFFPATHAASGLLLTYATFAIPFFVRPFGGILFSHIGDRKGRKVKSAVLHAP